MESDKTQEQEDRKFLHDLATPLTILKFRLKKLLMIVDSKDEAVNLEAQKESLNQMLRAVDTIEALHAEHKIRIHNRQSR